MTRSLPRTAATAVLVVTTLLSAAACGTSTDTEDGPVQVSSAEPGQGSVPALGSASSGGVSVAGVALRKNGSGIAVLASVTSDHGDRLLSIASNYTQTAVLPKPLEVPTSSPTPIDPTTAVLRPAGPIDDGATVSVTFTFATAGIVQVFGTYKA